MVGCDAWSGEVLHEYEYLPPGAARPQGRAKVHCKEQGALAELNTHTHRVTRSTHRAWHIREN